MTTPRFALATIVKPWGNSHLFAKEFKRDTHEHISWTIKPEQEDMVVPADEVIIRIDDEQDQFCHIVTVNP